MKKRILLTAAASFGLAASAPLPAPDASAATAALIARAQADCSRANILPGFDQRLRDVFATQSPRAIVQLQQRGLVICLDERNGALSPGHTDREAIAYTRSWSTFSLPFEGDYSARPRLFNVIADAGRTTVFEKIGIMFGNIGNQPAVKDSPELRRAQAEQVSRHARTPDQQVEIQARVIFGN